tara:strand:- start:75 stop:830 length:756 start_codon:yes stop_codon:yes gene_type:complete
MSSYLEVNFDQKLVINKFKELSIPIVGYSRPVIFFLISIESGSDKPYYVSQESNNELDALIIETLAELSNERGLFLELPVLDLEDKKYISNTNILSSPKEYLISKYDYDEFVDVKLTNLGLNHWLFSGDIEENIPAENYIEDIKKAFTVYVESRIQSIYKNLIIDTSKTLLLDVTIEGINSYEEYEISKDKLSKIIAISNIEIINFKNNTIAYKVNVMGNFNTFKSSIKNNTFFEIITDNSINSLNLRFKK